MKKHITITLILIVLICVPLASAFSLSNFINSLFSRPQQTISPPVPTQSAPIQMSQVNDNNLNNEIKRLNGVNLELNNQYLSCERRNIILNDAILGCRSVPIYKSQATTFSAYSQLKQKYESYEGKKYPMSGLSTNKEVIQLAASLRRDSVEETIDIIWLYINNNLKFKYTDDGSRTPEMILKSGYGDCTDISKLMYNLLGLNGITVRYVYGNCYQCRGGTTKHDWVEVLYPVQDNYIQWLYWKPYDKGDVKLGNGRW